MSLHLEDGFNLCTEDDLNDLLGYLGTWVKVIFYPAIRKDSESEGAHVGRFLGFHVNDEKNPEIIFEGYSFEVDGEMPFEMAGINEDEDEDV